MCIRIYCTRYIWLACLRKKKPKKWHTKLGSKYSDIDGTVIRFDRRGRYYSGVSPACVWVPLRYECLPMGVSSHIDWNEVLATRACMYARLSTSRFKRPHVVTRISWETVASKRREPTVNRVLTRPPSRLLGCNGVSLEHLSRISAHSKRYRTIWRCNN